MPSIPQGAAPAARKLIIAPSLLAADFGRLKDEVEAVEEAGADWLHLDVMDGHFVPNISFGPTVIRAVRRYTRLTFDVHLMISPADPFIAAIADAGADRILVHAEAGPHLHRTLELIRYHGKRAGVVLNPATPLEAAASVIDMVDTIMLMTVNPGFGGQSFLPNQLPRIATVRRMIDSFGTAIALQVDGGIAPGTARQVVAAGADTLAVGSAVFRRADYARAITELREDGLHDGH